MDKKINPSRFYFEWKGHPLSDVSTFYSITLSKRPDKPIVYLVGDSSFDNKAWVSSSGPGGDSLPVPIPKIYDSVLERPYPKPDVAFWLNHFLDDRATAFNLAVEESMLRERSDSLLEHDKFVRDHIRAKDIVVVSIGANDIALKPTLATILHMLVLAWLTPHRSLERGNAWALQYFTWLFKDQIQEYISKLLIKQKPRVIVPCMIYFPLESNASNQSSWADLSLKLLGYNRSPGRLQTAIRKMYEVATSLIRIPGVKVVPCALFDVMDGKTAEEYTARVEPSTKGGRRMALKLTELLDSFITADQKS